MKLSLILATASTALALGNGPGHEEPGKPQPPKVTTVKGWGPCGGYNYPGDFKCIEGFSCASQNEWYHQCVPAETSANAKTTHTKPSHTKPSHTKPSHTKPSHTKPSHTKPSHTEPSHTKGKPTSSIITTTSKPTSTVAGWGNCGGLNNPGDWQCTNGFSCSSQNEWYYQCVPAATTTSYGNGTVF